MIVHFIQEVGTASKWFVRSLKKGDWVWLMVAVIIASSTVTVVKQLGETVQQSMLRKASASLGADLVIRSTRPIEAKWHQLATDLGLSTSRTTSVVTMAMVTDDGGTPFFQLVNLNGISKSQPLRGQWTPNSGLKHQPLTADSAWVDPELLALLPLNQNSKITLGTKEFELAGAIQSESLVNPMANIAPKIWIQYDQIDAIGLVGPGSRVSYVLNVAGEHTALTKFAEAVHNENNPAWQLTSAEAPSRDVGNSMETAWLFLDLSALSAVLVAGMSILIASRFYLARWKQSIALMRAFGASNAKMNRLFALQMSWIAVVSSAVGVLIGYGLSIAIEPLLSDYFDPIVVAEPDKAMLIGFLSGLLVLWTFAWQAFNRAVKTPPMHILKTVPDQKQHVHWFISFVFLLGLISLMLNVNKLHWIMGGILLVSVILYVASEALLKLLNLLQRHTQGWFKIALANVAREPNLAKVQLVSVGMVLFVLMLMTFVRQDLISNWQASLPDSTPNAFVMNIQETQKPLVDRILQHSVDKKEAAMVRGRLVKINGQDVFSKDMKSSRAARLLRRESNIAVLAQIPEHNTIVAKLDEGKQSHPQVSIEREIAELFSLNLGDLIDFSINGQDYRYQVGSLREVQWQSFQLNFFFIIEPVIDRPLPISYLTNFVLPALSEQNQKTTNDIANQYTKQLAAETPGVLLIDVRKIMAQIQDIMNQASWAVSALYGFTLLASIIVLFTATLASQQSRVQSWLLLRTIGAPNRDIIKIGLTEFVFLGGLAGLFSASLAQLSSLLISHFILNISPKLDWALWMYSIVIGSGLFLLIGLITQWSYLQKSAQELKHYLAHH